MICTTRGSVDIDSTSLLSCAKGGPSSFLCCSAGIVIGCLFYKKDAKNPNKDSILRLF